MKPGKVGGQKQLHYMILNDGGYDKYGLTKLYRYYTGISGYKCHIDTPDGGYVSLTSNGILTIGPYSTWDGPSGPAIDTISFMRASLVHDKLYFLIEQGVLPKKCRRQADYLMRCICIEDGMPRFRAWYAWLGVRLAGWTHT